MSTRSRDPDLERLISLIDTEHELSHWPSYPALTAGMLPFRSVFRESTLREFVLYLERSTGLRLYQLGRRRVLRLFHEWMQADLALKQANDNTLLRIASNARTEIHAVLDGLSLQEVGRKLLWDNNRMIKHDKPKSYGSSETKKRSELLPYEESPIAAALRGLREEYWLLILPDQLTLLTTRMPRTSIYVSSAYPFLTSVVSTWKFKIEIDHVSDWCSDAMRHSSEPAFGNDVFEVTDVDVVLYLKWLPPQS